MTDIRYSEIFDKEQQERLIQAGVQIDQAMWTIGSLVNQMAEDKSFARKKVHGLSLLCKAAGAFTLLPSRLVRLAAEVWGKNSAVVYPENVIGSDLLGFWHYEQAHRLPDPTAALIWATTCVDELGRPATVDAMAAAFKSEKTPDPAKTAIKAKENARRRALDGLGEFIEALENGTIVSTNSKVLAMNLRPVYRKYMGQEEKRA